MSKIIPVTDLGDYTAVLTNCTDGAPVFLTENGRGRYVIMDIYEYEKQVAMLDLYEKLSEAEAEIEQEYEDFDSVASRIRENIYGR